MQRDRYYVVRSTDKGLERITLEDAHGVGILVENGSLELGPGQGGGREVYSCRLRSDYGRLMLMPEVSNVCTVQTDWEGVNPVVTKRSPDELEKAAAYGAVRNLLRLANAIGMNGNRTKTADKRSTLAAQIRLEAEKIERALQ